MFFGQVYCDFFDCCCCFFCSISSATPSSIGLLINVSFEYCDDTFFISPFDSARFPVLGLIIAVASTSVFLPPKTFFFISHTFLTLPLFVFSISSILLCALFCWASKSSVAVSFPTTSSLSFGILLCLIVTFPKALNLILSWIFSNFLYFSSLFVLSFLITSLNSLQYFAVSSVYTDQLVPGKGALFQTFSTWHPNTFCPYCIYWPSTAFYWPNTTKYQPVPLHTDLVPPNINQYQPILFFLGDYRLLHSLPRVLF